MVKNLPKKDKVVIKPRKENPFIVIEGDDSNIIYSSPFIVPSRILSDDDILHISNPVPHRVHLSTEDETSLPRSHNYTYFIDYRESTRSEDQLEDELTKEELDGYNKWVVNIYDRLSGNIPEKGICEKVGKVDPLVQDIANALMKSPYKYEFFDYMFKRQATPFKLLKEEKVKREPKTLRKTYTIDQMKQIVDLYVRKKLKPSDIAKTVDFVVDKSQIVNFIRSFEQYGMNVKPKKKEKVKKDFDPLVSKYVIDLVSNPNYNTLSVKDIGTMIFKRTGNSYSFKTISDILKANGYSKKQARPVIIAADCVAHKNARIKVVHKLLEFWSVGMEMVSLDETQVNKGLMATKTAWGKKGEAAIVTQPNRNNRPIHILAGVLKDRMLGYVIRNDRIKAFSYKFFLQQVIIELRKIDPVNYRSRFFIFMDNACAHKMKLIKDFCEYNQIKVLCNAPMTPQLNPIEFVFSLLKRDLNKRLHDTRESLLVSLYQSFYKIHHSPEKLYNTFLHTLRFYKPVLRYEDLHNNMKGDVLTKTYMDKPARYTSLIRLKKMICDKKEKLELE